MSGILEPSQWRISAAFRRTARRWRLHETARPRLVPFQGFEAFLKIRGIFVMDTDDILNSLRLGPIETENRSILDNKISGTLPMFETGRQSAFHGLVKVMTAGGARQEKKFERDKIIEIVGSIWPGWLSEGAARYYFPTVAT